MLADAFLGVFYQAMQRTHTSCVMRSLLTDSLVGRQILAMYPSFPLPPTFTTRYGNIVQPADIGLLTGNGKELSCSQAQLGQATCLAVASFLSISCGPSYFRRLYTFLF